MTKDTCNAGSPAGRQAGARIWAAIQALVAALAARLEWGLQRCPGAPGTSMVLIGDYGSLLAELQLAPSLFCLPVMANKRGSALSDELEV